MAIRFTHFRPALVVAALAATTAVVPSIASAAPAAPSAHQKPTIDSVQKQLGALALQNSELVEQFNQARVNVTKRDQAAAVARQQAAKAEATYQAANVEFAQSLQANYQAGSLGSAGALLDSDSGSNYVDRLDTLNMVSAYDSDVVSRLQSSREAAQAGSAKAAAMLTAAKKQRDAVGAKQDAVTKQMTKYKTLLGTLNAQQRAAFAQASSGKAVDLSQLKSMPSTTSAAAKKAVNFALAQVGKPYVFGAAGPGSYDCSGLTMDAWQKGGVSLPHSAAGQYGYGHHVDMNHLSPGDLIFMYHPIGHVTIYIGGGLMVSAPTEGENVKVVPVSHSQSDIVGATHLG